MKARNMIGSRSVLTGLATASLLVCACPQSSNSGGGGGTGQTSSTKTQDLWTTNTQSSSMQDFSSLPMPAGFFDFNGRSCDGFSGSAAFVGSAISENTTGVADTIVTRDRDPIAPNDPVGTTGTVAVRITGLNLRSAAPIEVLCDGQPTEWHVHATLSDTGSPAGTLRAEKTHDNGGTAETTLPVLLKLTFTNVADPSVQRVLDFAESGLAPVEFQAELNWVHRIDPGDPNAQSGFFVGVAGGPEAAKLVAEGKAGRRLQGGQTLIACSEHGNPGGSHLHNTCTADTDLDTVPDASDKCRFVFDPEQRDMDGDLFGDPCDPCPEDPQCPQDGGECDSVCPDVNDELRAIWADLIPIYCEIFANCLCIPPSCDPSQFQVSTECNQLFSEVTNTTQEFACLYTRFTGWGCDRCVLPALEPLSCPDPCETTTCPDGQTCQQFVGCVAEFDSCQFAACPDGQGCDPRNGQCCEDPISGCPLPNPCSFITCPTGSQCNPATAYCWDPESGACFQPVFGSDLCASVTCPEGDICNPSTGSCLGTSNPCASVTCGDLEYCDPLTGSCASFCQFVTCPDGLTCNPETIICE